MTTTTKPVLAAARRAGLLPSATSRASWAAGVFAVKATISISDTGAVRVYLRDSNGPAIEQFHAVVGFGNCRELTKAGKPSGTWGWDSADRQQLAGMLFAFEPWLAGVTHDKAAAALDRLRPGWRREPVS